MSALTVSLKHLAGNCSTARNRVSLFILRQRYEIYWNFLRNPSSRRLFEVQRLELSGAQQQVVRDLRSHGLSFARFTELGTDAKRWNRLRETVDGFARSAKVREAIENYAAGVARGEMAMTRTLSACRTAGAPCQAQ